MFFKKRSEMREKTEVDTDTLNVLLSEVHGGNASWSGISALRNSDIYTAVKSIAVDVASSPFEIKVNDISEKESDLYYLLNKRPNKNMTPWHFRFIITANMLLNGKSFVEIKRAKDMITELVFHRNSTVTFSQRDGSIVYTVVQIDGATKEVPAENMLHFRMFTLDGFNDYSPLHALAKEISIQEGSKSALDSFFRKGAMVGGVVKLDKALKSTEELTEKRKEFSEAYGGAMKAGGVLALDSTMTFDQLEIPTEILKFLNSYTFSTAQVAKVFGLPLEKLGIETTNTSQSQSQTDYLKSTLYPIFACFSSEMEFKMIEFPANRITEISFNVDRLMEMDPETKAKVVKELVQGSLLTPNEGRARFGDAPQSGGDELLASLNYTQLSGLAEYQKNRSARGYSKVRSVPQGGDENG
ncbi:phage portal protein [Listeria monocytogenes]|nr:phage portal protein [Listeria monocytogenes]EJD7520781.1 phage portal protein [Listeria monocytogenes]EKL5555343.1 phage portal protein [Listeria monocytogenes]MCE8065646.1 phage portal protein [Listeria monocytogenes]MCP6813766.1 phage portal protein [Listeria monocytogenes]